MVIESSKQITRNKEISKWMVKWSLMQTSLQGQQEIKIDILKEELSNKSWLIYWDGHWIWTGVTKEWRQRIDTIVLREIICFGRQYSLFFPTCHALKTWFKLSREQLYTNYLKGKQKLLRVIWRFKLSRARVTEGKITVNLWRKSRGDKRTS